ncbi:UNVERIFIED_CONTAM: hypothetical protein RMT77_005451 [Armadillidium vulgare]
MPGLRSLVARRRCSLPSAPISSEPVICTYPLVPGIITSRKGHSLDEIIQKESIPDKIDNVPPDDKSQENIESPFKVENEFYLSKSQNEITNSCENNFQNNVTFLSEKENFNGINSEMASSPVIEQSVNSQSLSSKENDLESNLNKVSESISPERIIIKMKLLHGSSLSDVTNITSESSSDGSEVITTEFKYEEPKTAITHWTIDSILNKPVINENVNIYTRNENDSVCVEKDNSDRIEDSTEYEINNSSIGSQSSVNINNVSEKLLKTELNNCTEGNDKNLILKIISTPEKVTVEIPQTSEISQCELARRPSNSSETSEDSVCSEASTLSSNSLSSDSSLKSCSIVIKRLENSNTYSCFRSPKSKRKRGHSGKSRRKDYQAKQDSQENYLLKKYNNSLNCNGSSNALPCSVTLCDIFSNYPFPKEVCPSCSQYYDIESDMYVDICSNTLTLQCYNCKWLVIKRIKLKEVDVVNLQPQNCSYV